MGDEPFTTQRETCTKPFSTRSQPSTSQLQAAYATERARLLFGCYRRGDANDPDTYVAAIAAVLAMYDADLIREVTDPRTGIQTTEKHMTFMPQSGELKVYCEARASHREHMKRLAALPRPVPRLAAPDVPGRLGKLFIPADHPRYPGICEWAKTAEPKWWRFGKSSDGRDGIWIPLNIWEEGESAKRAIEASRTMTHDELLAHYTSHSLRLMPRERDHDDR